MKKYVSCLTVSLTPVAFAECRRLYATSFTQVKLQGAFLSMQKVIREHTILWKVYTDGNSIDLERLVIFDNLMYIRRTLTAATVYSVKC